MAYDEPFWATPRFGVWSSDPAWTELHDYDFEMRGPYEPGKLLDAYMEWREFQRENRRYPERRSRGRGETNYELLRRWEEWRRRKHHPELARRLRPRRRGPVRGPRWPREGL